MTKYYYDGKLYNENEWDFDLKRPKVKDKKAVVAEPETQVEAVAEEVKEETK